MKYIGGDIMNNLKLLRDRKGISVRDLGTKLNINYGSLSRMENGTQKISDEQAIALADYFNISIDHLLGREWHNPETTVYKTVDFDIKDVYRKLQTYSKTELIELRGAIDFILETKFTPGDNGQLIKNKIDELIKTK
jgi:transcriptional regulator with XRE-family HTH domain